MLCIDVAWPFVFLWVLQDCIAVGLLNAREKHEALKEAVEEDQ